MASLSDLDYVSSDEEEEAIPTHDFSSPWEDSDLVLVVENQNLHVHSIILKMMSPVFKAMLSGDFKEKNQQEIPLPGKKADQFVDFLRQIYPQCHFYYPVDLENIQHVYHLSNEYQVESIVSLCHKVLRSTKVTQGNLSKMIDLAQTMGCRQGRQNCYKILNDMNVKELKKFADLNVMDSTSFRHTLFTKAEHLEKCLKMIQPQFVGVLDCLSYVWEHIDTKTCEIKYKPVRCPTHMPYSTVSGSITERLKCTVCVKAWNEMVSKSKGLRGNCFYSSTSMKFDKNIVAVLEEMVKVLKTK